MKKLTLLIFIALLFMTATLISCAESGSSTVTGYNTISWQKDIMAPAAGKSYLMGTMDSAGTDYDDVLSVCYSAESKELSSDTATTYFTGFAIASDDRSERLIIVIRNYDLFDDTKTFPEALNNTTHTVSVTYVNGTSVSTYTGYIDAEITLAEVTSPVPDVDGGAVTYYQTTLDMTGGFSVGGLTITSSHEIVAMTYPFTEPNLY